MKLTTITALLAVTAGALLSACGGDDDKTTTPSTPSESTIVTDVSFPTGDTIPAVTLPPGLTIPPGGTFPPDLTIPQAVVDQMITQFEAAGLKVDRACFENLLQDEELRRLIAGGDTPSAEVIQRLTACFQQ
jgi:hypothetical protein